MKEKQQGRRGEELRQFRRSETSAEYRHHLLGAARQLNRTIAAAAAAAKLLESCPTLGDPIDSSPPGLDTRKKVLVT